MGDPQIKLRHLRDIMEMIFSVQEEDIDCDECGEHLDVYADKLRDGEEPAEILPSVKRHLEQCLCCREEFEALLTMLEADSIDNSLPPEQP